ncbi:hypothetical protein LZ554_004500 [Drepanopeziza brunnea f. sp. 'monogermtubi']|nr:hypothetical protein LZ554_004500 [Drepanopeziza brunnea f. sp. 'monogermtubi']
MGQYRSVLDQEAKALLLRRNEEDSIRNEEARRKRAAFQRQIDDNLNTEEGRAIARLQQLVAAEDERLKLLTEGQGRQMERLAEKHAKELADAENERSRALEAYLTKATDGLKNFIAAWDQEQAQLEADIEKEEADIQQARNNEDQENKEKWFNVPMGQTSLGLASGTYSLPVLSSQSPATAGTSYRQIPKSSPKHASTTRSAANFIAPEEIEQDPRKTVFHPSDLHIITPPREPTDGFAAANNNDILPRGEKRRFSDLQSPHRFSDSNTVGLAATNMSEESSLKKAKTAAPKPVLKLDPRYCFEVTHLFYRRRGAPGMKYGLLANAQTDAKVM